MREKILLISEKKEDLDLIKKILDTREFVITRKPSLQGIQQKIYEENFAVILADYNMILDNADLMDDFQKNRSLSCFIFYGNKVEIEEISEILQKGVYAFIPRPLLSERIYDTVLEGLEHRKAFVDVMYTIDKLKGINERFEKENEALTKKNIELNFIIKLNQEVAHDLTWDRILPRIVEIGYKEVLDYSLLGLFYRFGPHWNMDLHLPERQIRKKNEETLKTEILSQLLPLWTENISKEDVAFHLISPKGKKDASVSYFSSDLKIFPLSLGSKQLGNLIILPKKRERFMNQRDDLMTTFTNILVLSLNNAQEYQKARELSITDSLTGIYNLKGLNDFIKKEFHKSKRHNRSLSLLIIRVDNIKEINESHSRHAGDFVLRDLSGYLKSFIRRSDILARYGKEKFSILLPETNFRGAEDFIKRTLSKIKSHRFEWRSKKINVVVSYGIANTEELSEEENETNFVQIADSRLNIQKMK